MPLQKLVAFCFVCLLAISFTGCSLTERGSPAYIAVHREAAPNAWEIGIVDSSGKFVAGPFRELEIGGRKVAVKNLNNPQSETVSLRLASEALSDDMAVIVLVRRGKTGEPVTYQSDKEVLYGFIDKTGKVVVEPKYSDVSAFSDGLAAVSTDKLWGYIDKTGSMVIEPKFTDPGPFKNGLVINKQAKEGSTRDTLPTQYFDKTGAVKVATESTDVATHFANGKAVYFFRGKGNLIDSDGKVICSGMINPPEESSYEFEPLFNEGWVSVQQGYMNAKCESAKINFKEYENMTLTQVDRSYPFSDGLGLAKVMYNDRRASGGFERGFVYLDKDLKMIGPTVYAAASPFREGRAFVKLKSGDKGWTLIDKNFKPIGDLQYDLQLGGDRLSASLFTNGIAGHIKITNPPAGLDDKNYPRYIGLDGKPILIQ